MSKYSKIFKTDAYNYLDNLNVETAISENVIMEDTGIKLNENYIYDEDLNDIVGVENYYAMIV